MLPYFERFLRDTTWRILVWSGDADAAVPFEGTQRWVECLGQPVKEDWAQWFTDDATYGRQVRRERAEAARAGVHASVRVKERERGERERREKRRGARTKAKANDNTGAQIQVARLFD
jgi:hypothetical protein